MTPLKITATLAEPVATYDDGIYIDGLLAYARLCERQKDGETFPDPNHVDFPVDFSLPLAHWTCPPAGDPHPDLLNDDGKLWGWRASDAIWPDHAIRSSTSVRRMTDQDQMVRHTDADSLKTATGALKNKDKTVPTRHARRIHWYAVGHGESVATLLHHHITHIGKLHGHGQGRVMEWSVEPVDDDHSLTVDGQLMRPMPTTWCKSDTPSHIETIRAPYWHPSREVPCYPAGAEVKNGLD